MPQRASTWSRCGSLVCTVTWAAATARQLADITLWWMKDAATTCGLLLDNVADGIDSSWVDGRLHHSDKGFWRVLPPYIRPIGQVDPKHESAASTAVARLDSKTYSPDNLETYLKSVGKKVTDIKTRD